MLFAKKMFVAVESINIVRNQDYNNATLFAEINSPMLLIDDFSSPENNQSFSNEVPTQLNFNLT